jgi:hypothetical protein
MLISTLYSLFSWRIDLFNWLYIKEKTDYNFDDFPIIFIDFSDFNIKFNNYIYEYIFNKINISYKWKQYNINDFWYSSINGLFSLW